MAENLDPLLRDLVQWVAREPRPYHEVMDAWRTHCPRLTIWEDAVDRGFVQRENANGQGRHESIVRVTDLGRKFLAAK